MLNVGVLLPTRAALLTGTDPCDLEFVLGMARRAESSGYGSVWIGDSLLASPRPEALVTLSAIAARTSRIRVGSAILISSLRHPALLAHQLATTDLISAGRLIVGIGYSSGTGLWKDEQALAGQRADSRHRRTREGIEVMRALWARPSANHEGSEYRFQNVNLEPKPVQRPGPPIWLHGMRGAKTLRYVGELADGWINNLPTVAQFAAGRETVLASAALKGRATENFETCHYCTIRLGTDRAATERDGRAFMQAYYGGMDPMEIERIESCTYGTADLVAASILKFQEAGATAVIVRFASDDQDRQMDLFAERVLPTLQR